MTLMHCCDRIDIVRTERDLEIDDHYYQVVLIRCSNCGELKSTTHVKQLKK